VFGEVAELYDAHRPGYPGELIDDVVGLAGLEPDAGRVLAVGAGTGKAAALFAARGYSVTAIEPSAAMAAPAACGRCLGDGRGERLRDVGCGRAEVPAARIGAGMALGRPGARLRASRRGAPPRRDPGRVLAPAGVG
jgi:hypothetical protein